MAMLPPLVVCSICGSLWSLYSSLARRIVAQASLARVSDVSDPAHTEAYNAVELVIAAIAIAAGIDLCAVLIMPVVRVPRWFDLLLWSGALVFVIVLRLIMPVSASERSNERFD
jgi:hypothetical protein